MMMAHSTVLSLIALSLCVIAAAGSTAPSRLRLHLPTTGPHLRHHAGAHAAEPVQESWQQLPAAFARSSLPAPPYKGYVYFAWGAGSYSSTQSQTSLRALAATGVQVVEIGLTWYGDNEQSTEVRMDPQQSPTMQDMLTVIGQARALNMSVVLKPHVDLKNGAWRANIGVSFSEQQWGQWWASYNTYMDWVLALAQQTGVDAINIGTELCATEHREQEWRALAQRLRQKGWSKPLWYGTNWNWQQACPAQPRGCPGGPLNITWWDAVDAIGVDAYYPLAQAPGSSVAQLVQAWAPIVAPLTDLSRRLQRPLLFPELGYASFPQATVQPWACCSGAPDLEAQRSAFDAFFQGPWSMRQVLGVFWWAWSPSDVPAGSCNTNFAIYGKPAQGVVAARYGGQGPPTRCTAA